jgi:hypothetical protein
MYGYEPPVTDASKANEQYTKNVQLQFADQFWQKNGRNTKEYENT